jgi:hypothetical protein
MRATKPDIHAQKSHQLTQFWGWWLFYKAESAI